MHDPSYKDTQLLNIQRKQHTHIPALNMFIIIHGTVHIIAEMKQSGVLIFYEELAPQPATSLQRSTQP